ncbi:hypothetical protein DL765_008596 [Monosporascus sp. GIB2]|nr:hypothetical protein DL765_008596 [Monosporascus sp. GIB2]
MGPVDMPNDAGVGPCSEYTDDPPYRSASSLTTSSCRWVVDPTLSTHTTGRRSRYGLASASFLSLKAAPEMLQCDLALAGSGSERAENPPPRFYFGLLQFLYPNFHDGGPPLRFAR